MRVKLNGFEYDVEIVKVNNREHRLIVIGCIEAPIVYNHTPEKCIESLKMQWIEKKSNNRFEVIK